MMSKGKRKGKKGEDDDCDDERSKEKEIENATPQARQIKNSLAQWRTLIEGK